MYILDDTLQIIYDGYYHTLYSDPNITAICSHNPILSLISSSLVSDTPLKGTALYEGTYASKEGTSTAQALVLSDGSLICVYSDHDYARVYPHNRISYNYTDSSRSVFYTHEFRSIQRGGIENTTFLLCELDPRAGVPLVGVIEAYASAGSGIYNGALSLYYWITTTSGISEIDKGSIVYIYNPNSYYTYTRPTLLRAADGTYIIMYTAYDNVGGTWGFYKRTSTNFTAWTAEASVSISGLMNTRPIRNCSLVKDADGDLHVFFEYVEGTNAAGTELANLYFSTSVDDGVSWGVATKITNYTQYSAIGYQPDATCVTNGQLILSYIEKTSVLYMPNVGSDYNPRSMSWDQDHGKLYVVMTTGGYTVRVVRIDYDTWTIDDSWSTTTSPAFRNVGNGIDTGAWFAITNEHDDEYIVLHRTASSGQDNFVWLINGNTDQITEYCFCASGTYGGSKNVDGWVDPGTSGIVSTVVDKDHNKLWVLLYDSNVWRGYLSLGYFALDDAGPTYQWNSWATDGPHTGNSGPNGIGAWDFCYERRKLRVDEDNDWVGISAARQYQGGLSMADRNGLFYVWNYQTKALWFSLWAWLTPNFPIYGLNDFFYSSVNGRFYGIFDYYALDGQADFRGLFEYDPVTQLIQYLRPSWGTYDDYLFKHMCAGPNDTILISGYYGLSSFDPATGAWVLYNNENVPGINPIDATKSNNFILEYMSGVDLIAVGDAGWDAVVLSLDGGLQKIKYMEGTKAAGWTWGTAAALVDATPSYYPCVVADPSTSIGFYTFWSTTSKAYYSSTSSYYDVVGNLYWGKVGSEIELATYLSAEHELSFERSIDGRASRLSFTLSTGTLFDPYNTTSLLSTSVRKGRKLALRIGELFNGTEYWANQGVYIITETSIKYEKGNYISCSVVAEDMRTLWNDKHVYATDYYSGINPSAVISDILTTETMLTASDIKIQTTINSSTIEHQWVELPLNDILKQIFNRFGYYYCFTLNDNKLTWRKITTTITDADVYAEYGDWGHTGGGIHKYYDGTEVYLYDLTELPHGYKYRHYPNTIITYTPDDRYSNFTNRVTVQGQERTFTEVAYPEERMETIHGTAGFWGLKQPYTIWYSADKMKKCRNPRYIEKESVKSLLSQLGLAGATDVALSTAEFPDENGCALIVTCPSLVPQLIAVVAAMTATIWLGDLVAVAIIAGITIPLGSAIRHALLVICLMILGSAINFQYEIWATPTGLIRRSCQDSWNDTDLQTEIGFIVEQKLTDELCYSSADCSVVANHEGMVVQAQRKRVSVSKVAHLQDTEGDIIQFYHPYSKATVKMFITNLTRRFLRGTNGDGYLIDDLEGWITYISSPQIIPTASGIEFYPDPQVVRGIQIGIGEARKVEIPGYVVPSLGNNDFSTDSHALALYRFEESALTVDSKGSNTLTEYGPAIPEATGDRQEGTSAAYFYLGSNGFYAIADSALPTNFPLKYGGTNRKFSWCFWMHPEDIDYAYIVGKSNYYNDPGITITYWAESAYQEGYFCVYYGEDYYDMGPAQGDPEEANLNGYGDFEYAYWDSQDVYYVTPNPNQWMWVCLNVDLDAAWFDMYVYLKDDNKWVHLWPCTWGNGRYAPIANPPILSADDYFAIGNQFMDGTQPQLLGDVDSNMGGVLDEVLVFDHIISYADMQNIKDGVFSGQTTPVDLVYAIPIWYAYGPSGWDDLTEYLRIRELATCVLAIDVGLDTPVADSTVMIENAEWIVY